MGLFIKLLNAIQTNLLYVFLVLFALIIIGFWYALVKSYRTNRVRLLNGYLLSILLFLMFGFLSIVIFLLQSRLLLAIWLGVFGIILALLIVISLSLWLFLILNGIVMWRKESRNLANSLTLFLGIFIFIFPFINNLLAQFLPKWLLITLNTFEGLSVAYVVINFIAFIASFILLRLTRLPYDREYIIILGSGLIDGHTVSNLLGSRIKRGIQFANKQIAATGKRPYLIFSGGQGADEQLAEGQAMLDYTVKNALYDPAYLIAETKSLNTLQNMQFSKAIVEERGFALDKGAFATSDYHVYRATGFALFAGLNIAGLGAKTRKYFIPSALLREYVAILSQHKRLQALMLSFIFGGSLLIGIVNIIANGWH
jgi:uncharacterized SAM-binding protein YcdF (DUF218 family)